MNTQKITINQTEYTVKFGFAANRILAKIWKLKTLGEIGNKLAKTFKFKKGAEPTIEQLVGMGDLVLAGILSVQPDAQITNDDVCNSFFEDFDTVTKIVLLYGESMPKPPEQLKNVKRG